MTTSGDVALVTGASSGIGLELAKLLAANGHDLVLVARREKEMRDLADQLSRQHEIAVRVVAADLARPGAPERIAEALASDGVEVGTLVNNAGFGLRGSFTRLPVARQLDQIQVNVTALTHLTALFLPGMQARKRGRVLNVASTAAFQPGPQMAVYYATKAYVLSLSVALAVELEGTGVTVTTLCPGLTVTEFHEVAEHLKSDAFMRHAMTAEDVAEIGIRAALKGKAVVTAGFTNQLLGGVVKILPRSTATAIAGATMRNASADPAQRQLTPGANR